MGGLNEGIILSVRMLVACGLLLFGIMQFVAGLPEMRFFWPSIFIVGGVFALAGIVFRPMSSTTIREIYDAYLATGRTAEQLDLRRRLFGRLSVVLYVLGLLWLVIGMLTRLYSWPVGAFGENPMLGALVGSSILLIMGSAARLYSVIIWLRAPRRS